MLSLFHAQLVCSKNSASIQSHSLRDFDRALQLVWLIPHRYILEYKVSIHDLDDYDFPSFLTRSYDAL